MAVATAADGKSVAFTTADIWEYFKDGHCKSCGYKATSRIDEANHIRSCPVNPHPGYVDKGVS